MIKAYFGKYQENGKSESNHQLILQTTGTNFNSNHGWVKQSANVLHKQSNFKAGLCKMLPGLIVLCVVGQ